MLDALTFTAKVLGSLMAISFVAVASYLAWVILSPDDEDTEGL